MTTTIRRGGSMTAFTWTGNIAANEEMDLARALAQHRFRSIDTAASEEVSVGWCSPSDPTGDTFDGMHLAASLLWLRVRIDRKKLPAVEMQKALANAARSRGRPLSARERREVKDSLHEALLPRLLPRSAFVDVLVDMHNGVGAVFATGQSTREAVAKLIDETFGVKYAPLGPLELGARAAVQDQFPHLAGIERATCTIFPGTGPHQTEVATSHEFLGCEFLTWLLWKVEDDGGDFAIPTFDPVGLAFDDLLVFAPTRSEEHRMALRRGLPTKSSEARAALRRGHLLSRARLILAEGVRQWTFTLDADRMALASVRLPDDDEDAAPEDVSHDRAVNWLLLHQIVTRLYAQFLRVRLAEDWLRLEAPAMAVWMRGEPVVWMRGEPAQGGAS